MLRLKKLDLQGFKSFADPATFLYPTGITAVVGPNGSGKSNVADAIRWVLGEQRITSIRGRTGEDMIFAGSPKRGRAGMARAAITFDNSDGWLPVDFAEVTVERRAYRDGTSDYILNGSKIRLMDLRDLLDRGGLGRDAYLMIGQGLVDQVLSLRPQERLALFEQAAGITPYRTRREDAVGRLEGTRTNLQRVYDIIGEIEPRLRRLQRQASKAEEHIRLQQELNGTLRTWYGYRWGRALGNLEQARQRVIYREDKALALLEGGTGLEARVIQQREQISQYRDQLSELHRASSAQHSEAGARQRELAVARERQRQLGERIEESEANLVPLRTALEAELADNKELTEALHGLQARFVEAREALEESETAHRESTTQRNLVLRRQSEAQARAIETRHRLADRQSRLDQARERAAELERQKLGAEEAVAAGVERRRRQQVRVEGTRRGFDEVQVAFQAVRTEEAELEAQLEDVRQGRERARQAFNKQQADQQRSSARLEALERLHAEGAGLYAGVRAVLQAVERGDLKGLPGPVSTLLRVPAELERALEAALGSQLQDVVAQTWSDAQAAVEWLKRKRAGRATFLPLDTLRPSPPLELPEMPGLVGVASDLVGYDPAYQPAALLLLGRTAIVEDLPAARRLHRELRGSFRIVTLDGEIVRSSGSFTGGESRQAEGPSLLSRERERRELRHEVAALRKQVTAAQAELAESEERLRLLTGVRETVLIRRREAEAAVRRHDRAVEEAVRDLERLLQEAEWQQKRLAEAAGEQGRTQALTDRLTEACAVETAALSEAEALLATLEVQVGELMDDDIARTVAERRTALAVLDQERESRRVLLQSREREAARLQRQIAGHEQRIAGLRDELTLLVERLDGLVTDYEKAQATAEALAARIPPLEVQLAALEAEQVKLEAEEQTSRHTLREAEQRLAQAEVEASRREDQLQALKREIEETLNIVISNLPDSISTQQPLPLENIVSPLPTVMTLPPGLEGQIRDLRTQLRRLEPVNPAAKEEYDELFERHGFLREQMSDLERASAQLREIIGELDGMMDTMFSTTFNSIGTEFSRVFDILFSGGAAKLVLTEDDTGRPGVEISARPPGKRASSLSMLSGGERSLTAVALIFAVMRISPTPFCVLDEVDAMLDEANVGRFRRMLQELARETQFVIITHNRGTVEVADTIYGISMGDDGVSDVLSLSLEDLPASEVL
jgi:chromosome segregation protein